MNLAALLLLQLLQLLLLQQSEAALITRRLEYGSFPDFPPVDSEDDLNFENLIVTEEDLFIRMHRCVEDYCSCDDESGAVICDGANFREWGQIPTALLTRPKLNFQLRRLTVSKSSFRLAKILISADNFSNGIAESLEELVLSDCGISELTPNAFEGMSQLGYLDLSSNQLHHVAPMLFSAERLPSLQVLILSGNRKLRELPPNSLLGSAAVQVELDDCGLELLPSQPFNYPTKLNRLYFRNNKLRSLPRTLQPLFETQLEDVRLSGNPWNCDAQLAWLIDIFNARRQIFSDDPVCSSPSSFAGRKFESFNVPAVAEINAIPTTTMKPSTTPRARSSTAKSIDWQGNLFERLLMSTNNNKNWKTAKTLTSSTTVAPKYVTTQRPAPFRNMLRTGNFSTTPTRQLKPSEQRQPVKEVLRSVPSVAVEQSNIQDAAQMSLAPELTSIWQIILFVSFFQVVTSELYV